MVFHNKNAIYILSREGRMLAGPNRNGHKIIP